MMLLIHAWTPKTQHELETMPRGTCVEDAKWHELPTPLYEHLEDRGYLSGAHHPRPPPTNLSAFTGPPFLWSYDHCIRGDNPMYMGYRVPMDQAAPMNIGAAGDASEQMCLHHDNERLLFQQCMSYPHLSYEWPVNGQNVPTPPTPPFHEDCSSMMILPESEMLPPTDMRNNTDSISPPRKLLTSKKRKRECREDEEVYIKKPPNAFMIFRKEQRQNVMAQLNIRDSAMANKALGRMWKSLSEKEQEKYYQLADAEKRLHTQLHPNWSCTDNYGRKRRKQRSR
ncbi:transcription factor 7-like 1-D [Stigmatopora argus]